ncbi:ParB/RepB/Spo0J family partition protein [Caulobacter sp. FWC26]|uniref:ParB/RepB/Spo0J family partition protein n=1 Tax=Caulobacter sp. FWC26 TaxID=69665 RepID=UPI000C15551B|nr:ParB/RepB/Spo0J family partition protein [Caulobacter sp. FWC26]AZS19436.1 ParB/RepB/Spo0J family partition protein [Caulobacter sp. FWC26]
MLTTIKGPPFGRRRHLEDQRHDHQFRGACGGLVEDSGEPDGSRLKELPLTEIYEDPNNPRTGFDDAEIADLAASMREHKVLQPITVRPKDDKGYMIRFGARRFRAARLAGLETIPAVISTSDASEVDILAAQVIENDQREPLNTAEMTTAVERLMALGLNQAQVGEKLGRSKEAISIYAALRDLPPELKALAPSWARRTSMSFPSLGSATRPVPSLWSTNAETGLRCARPWRCRRTEARAQSRQDGRGCACYGQGRGQSRGRGGEFARANWRHCRGV